MIPESGIMGRHSLQSNRFRWGCVRFSLFDRADIGKKAEETEETFSYQRNTQKTPRERLLHRLGTAASKECPQAPSLSFSSPDRARHAPLRKLGSPLRSFHIPLWEPVHRLVLTMYLEHDIRKA